MLIYIFQPPQHRLSSDKERIILAPRIAASVDLQQSHDSCKADRAIVTLAPTIWTKTVSRYDVLTYCRELKSQPGETNKIFPITFFPRWDWWPWPQENGETILWKTVAILHCLPRRLSHERWCHIWQNRNNFSCYGQARHAAAGNTLIGMILPVRFNQLLYFTQTQTLNKEVQFSPSIFTVVK